MVKIRFSSVLSAFCIFVFSNAAANAQEAKLAALLQKSPAPANAVGYVNVPALKKLMADAEMPSGLSDTIVDAWFVSDLDTVSLTPRWEAGYATVKQELTADALAKSVGGYVDTVADKQVVWTPKQSYLVPLDANRVGFIRPAKRDLLSAWVRSNGTSKAPTFLTEQSAQSEQYLSMMIAIDLEDTFSPVTLEKRLATFESLKSADLKSAASVLASAKGMSIIVGRRSLKECIISIDFGQSPASLLPVANALLNEILNRNGTAAPEVSMWHSKVDKNKLSFQGPISLESLEGVLGIFTLSSHAETVVEAAKPKSETPAATSGGVYVSESKTYFGKVTGYIERVRKYSAQTTGYRAKWNDQQARHIDELGTLNVDPQMIDYGANVASLLRNDALTIRSGNIQAGVIKAEQGLSQTYSGVGSAGFGYGGYGGYGGYSNYSYNYDPNTSVDYQSVTDSRAAGAAYSDYRSTLSAIDKMTAEIRKVMTAKFNVQF